jgi:sterol 3beta-glucosyltransferase
MAAAVHHGGAGTTAAALNAGVPSVIVPFLLDQPFWARQLQELGVATAPVPRRTLSADRLAQARTQAVEDRELKDRAARLAQAMAREDGTGAAVEIIHRRLGI